MREECQRCATLLQPWGYTLGISSFLSRMWRRLIPLRIIPATNPGWERGPVLRNIAVTIGVLPGFLLWLSDRLIVLPCKPECSAHERHTNRHTFGTQGRKGGTHPHLSPSQSPGPRRCAPPSVVRWRTDSSSDRCWARSTQGGMLGGICPGSMATSTRVGLCMGYPSLLPPPSSYLPTVKWERTRSRPYRPTVKRERGRRRACPPTVKREGNTRGESCPPTVKRERDTRRELPANSETGRGFSGSLSAHHSLSSLGEREISMRLIPP